MKAFNWKVLLSMIDFNLQMEMATLSYVCDITALLLKAFTFDSLRCSHIVSVNGQWTNDVPLNPNKEWK